MSCGVCIWGGGILAASGRKRAAWPLTRPRAAEQAAAQRELLRVVLCVRDPPAFSFARSRVASALRSRRGTEPISNDVKMYREIVI